MASTRCLLHEAGQATPLTRPFFYHSSIQKSDSSHSSSTMRSLLRKSAVDLARQTGVVGPTEVPLRRSCWPRVRGTIYRSASQSFTIRFA